MSEPMPRQDGLPGIGSREAAVKSVVSMFADLCNRPEITMTYWLDLYYQVRRDYELEMTEARPEADIAVQKQDDPQEEKGGGRQRQQLDGGLPDGFEVIPPASPGAKPGNRNAAGAAGFKRETAQRLRQARQSGLRTPAIVEAAAGQLEAGDIQRILECKFVSIEKYRVLAAVLDKLKTP